MARFAWDGECHFRYRAILCSRRRSMDINGCYAWNRPRRSYATALSTARGLAVLLPTHPRRIDARHHGTCTSQPRHAGLELRARTNRWSRSDEVTDGWRGHRWRGTTSQTLRPELRRM